MEPRERTRTGGRRNARALASVLLVSGVATFHLLASAGPALARVAQLKFTGIGQIDGAGVGSFSTFMDDEVVDMTIFIEETTLDSDGSVGAGTYNDPTSITTFEGQSSGMTVSFTGFGFQLFNATRLDQASVFVVPAAGSNPSGRYDRDWDIFDLSPPISNVDNLFTILAELPNVTIGNVPADGFAIRSPNTPGNTTEFLHLVPTITLEVGCGNGIVESGETCDTVCCDSTCDNFAAMGTLCRPAAGPCDTPETCSDSAGTCPADGFEPSTTECRAVAGACDVAENCTGAGVDCPADIVVMSGVPCRTAAGPCDEVEECTGTDPACPPDTFSQFTCGTICRAAVDICDQPEFCASFAQTGTLDCPAGMDTPCTPTPTETPTVTPTGTMTPTNTPTPTPTNTSTNTPTNTPTPTPTSTPTNTPTNTPTGTPTNTPTATPTATPTSTPTFAPNENTAGDFACRDGFDNDNDGLLDCEDPDCADVPLCIVAPAPATSSQVLMLALVVLGLIAFLSLGRLRREPPAD